MVTAMRSPARGFALVEVLAATAVALLALVAAVRFYTELARAERLAVERSAAAVLAEERGESLLSLTRSGFEAPADGADAPAEPSGDGVIYSRSWSAAPPGRIVGLEVRVEWPAEAPLHQLRLFTASTAAATLESGYAATAREPLPPPP